MVVTAAITVLPLSSASAAKATTTTTPASTAKATVAGKTTPSKIVNVKAEVERKLADLQQKASPDLLVGKASCPPAMSSAQATSRKSASKPVTYRCTVLVEGVAAPYDVEIRDGGFLNGGTFVMARAKAIIDVTRVVAGTLAQLDEADRSTAKVDCGKAKVRVASVGDSIVCTVTYAEPKGKQNLTYVVRDLDGTIVLKL